MAQLLRVERLPNSRVKYQEQIQKVYTKRTYEQEYRDLTSTTPTSQSLTILPPTMFYLYRCNKIPPCMT